MSTFAGYPLHLWVEFKRNQIVHEADWDSVNARKRPIQKFEVDDIVLFIEKFVEAIHNNVK